MSEIYVLKDESGRMYEFHYPRSCMQTVVISTDNFKKARKFRWLWRAKRRARYLSDDSPCYYYVYRTIFREDGGMDFENVDPSLNDDIIESHRQLWEEIEKIIEDWKKTAADDRPAKKSPSKRRIKKSHPERSEGSHDDSL